jgi:hypothetical protein
MRRKKTKKKTSSWEIWKNGQESPDKRPAGLSASRSPARRERAKLASNTLGREVPVASAAGVRREV